jgi:hypothetical protein
VGVYTRLGVLLLRQGLDNGRGLDLRDGIFLSLLAAGFAHGWLDDGSLGFSRTAAATLGGLLFFFDILGRAVALRAPTLAGVGGS